MLGELEILKLIENRENSYVEFKEDSVDNKKIAREIIGLSNHKGGIIFLGVDDNGNVVGMTRSDNEERIMNICHDIVKPRIVPTYYESAIGEAKIGVIEIENGCNKPYYMEEQVRIEGKTKAKTVKFYFNRYGSTTREVKERDELQRLFQASQNIHFEVIPASYAKLEDLDLNAIDDYLKSHRSAVVLGEDNKWILLENLELVIKVDETLKPTIAGLILFGKEKVSKYLPQAGIMCVKVKGDTIADEKEVPYFFERHAFDNFDDAMAFFRKHNTTDYSIEGEKRKNYYDYPENAFRELLANAIIHRDYTIAGSQISVWVYNNRIEVKSPGRLPNTITVEKMKVGIKYHRNPVLAQYFYDANYVEKAGQGIPKANRWLKDNGNPELEIREDGDEVIVTMYKKREIL